MLDLVYNGGERICESVMLLFCYEVDCNMYVVKRKYLM